MMTKPITIKKAEHGFVARLRDTGYGHAHYRIETFDAAGKACWFLMQLSLSQRIRLQQTDASADINLFDYGVVLRSGWGH